MRLSDKDIADEKERQSDIIQRAEIAAAQGNHREAADLFGEAADAATRESECLKLIKKQMYHFNKGYPKKGNMMPEGVPETKESQTALPQKLLKSEPCPATCFWRDWSIARLVKGIKYHLVINPPRFG